MTRARGFAQRQTGSSCFGTIANSPLVQNTNMCSLQIIASVLFGFAQQRKISCKAADYKKMAIFFKLLDLQIYKSIFTT